MNRILTIPLFTPDIECILYRIPNSSSSYRKAYIQVKSGNQEIDETFLAIKEKDVLIYLFLMSTTEDIEKKINKKENFHLITKEDLFKYLIENLKEQSEYI